MARTKNANPGDAKDVEFQLREAIEAIDDGFTLYDAEDRLIICNQTYKNFHSQHSDQIVPGVRFEDLLRCGVEVGGFNIPEGEEEAWIQTRVRQHLNPEGPLEQHLPNGRWLRISDSKTKEGGIVSIQTDITEQKKSELALARAQTDLKRRNMGLLRAEEEQEKLQQTLLEVIQASPIAVGITNKSGGFLFWNSLFLKFGQNFTGSDGNNSFGLSFVNPGMTDELNVRLTQKGAVHLVEAELVARDEEQAWGLISMQNILFEAQDATLIWVHDITELKRQEAALIQSRLEAESANSAKSSFLAQMSHEIRTPMNGIIAMADLMSLTMLNKEQADMNSLIHDSSKTLLTILDDILDFSKIEAGKIEIETVKFSISSLVESVVQLLAHLATDKGLQLIIFLDPKIPDDLEGDPVRIRQVLTNLLSNAIKFTETGHIGVDISLQDQTAGAARIKFSVQDTGIGLTQEQISNLFRPFQQADSTITRRFGGTGLGLTISRKLVNLMGGEIQIESTFGEGASFFYELSLPVQSEQRSIMNFDLSGLHILAVAANPLLGGAFKKYLEYLGADASIVRTFDDAIAVIGEHGREPRNLDAIVNLDIPPNRFNETVLDAEVANSTNSDCPLVFAGLHLGAGAFKIQNYSAKTFVISHPYKRENLCETIAIAVGRATGADKADERQRSNDEPSGTVYAAPTLEEAAEQGALLLIAEDNPTNQTVIKLLMAKLGFAADIVNDGVEALTQLEEKPYGLLLTDCHMPEMDGYQLASEVRKKERGGDNHLPIIALTADTMTGSTQRCFDAGMDDFLAKPVDRNAIDQMICKWVPRAAELRRIVDIQETTHSEEVVAIDNNDTPVLDISYFRELIGGDDEMVQPLLQEYVDTTRPIIEELVENLETGDFEAARKAAHAGAGASKTAGALAFADICVAIEKAIVELDNDSALTYKDSVLPAFICVVNEVDTLSNS